jgi:hypothetical protein
MPSMFYVLHTPNSKTGLHSYENHLKGQKEKPVGGKPKGQQVKTKIDTPAHGYPFLLHSIAVAFSTVTINLLSSVLPPGKKVPSPT